jgi:hypothetical protein
LVDILYLERYIGKTVTIFTTSGGTSGSGFTGVLINVCPEHVTLLVCEGAAPCCPCGSACDFGCNGNRCNGGAYGFGGSQLGGFVNPLGAVTVIPCHAIAAFTHNAI